MAIADWIRRAATLFRRSRLQRDLDDEMRLHLELRQERLQAGGLSQAEARDAARRRFGNVARLREESVDAWGWRWLEQLAQDSRFGVRMLLRNPGMGAAAIVTLALATGATTSIFSIVNGVVLRPLPFPAPDELVQVYGRNWREDRGGVPDPITGPVASPELTAYAAQSTAFRGFAGYAVTTRLLAGPSGMERLTAVQAETTLFELLGVDAIAGRTFRTDDPPEVAVISARLWERRFGRSPSAPGRVVTLDDRPVTIVGVMPDAFQFPYRAASLLPGALAESRTDVWVPLPPLRTAGAEPVRRGRVSVIGRLAPGVSIDEAAAELAVIAARVEEQYRGTAVRVGVRARPLAEVVIGPVRRSLWMLFAAVGLVLAAACANVANLLLSRMAVRAHEVVTRAALGAGRLRLIRQFLAESLVLALLGGALGAAIARWGTDALVALASAKIPRAHEVALDWQAFGFLLLACVATAVLFGLAPALYAAAIDANRVTREAGRSTMGTGYRRVRDGLVVLEVALAFVLAVGAALVMGELARLRNVQTGMVTENVITLHVTPRAPAQDYYAIEARVSQVPGVRAAGFTQLVPLQNWGWSGDFEIRGRPRPDRPVAGLRYVTPGYFRALGVPILRGRGLTGGDTADAPRVILINDALARQYLPGEDPVGRELDRGVIIGVVGDVRHVGLDRPAEPEIYYPAAQNVALATDIGMSLIVRTSGRPEALVDALRSAIREVNPNLAVFNVKTMEQVMADSLWELNLYRWLIGLFALLTLVLAAIGLYGVIAYNAASRTREFAVRLALGSDPGALARLVLGRGVGLTTAGLGAGILAVLALTSRLQLLPIEAAPGIPTYAAISLVLVAIALAACLTPAIRVARVNPAAALRHE